MKLAWMLGWALLVAECATANAELVFSTVVQEGSVLPDKVAGETFTVTSTAEARALLDGKIYFWAKGTSSRAGIGSREGIWSWQNGAYTPELLEGDAVVSGVVLGLAVGKFDANAAGGVIKSFTINPSGALQVSVRLRGGNTNANNDRGVIYHKDGVNTLLKRASLPSAQFSTGVSLLPNGAAFRESVTVNAAPEQFLYVGVPIQNFPAIGVLADTTNGVIGENGSDYDLLGTVVQNADSQIAYTAQVTTGGGVTNLRVGVFVNNAYTFPIVTGTAIAGTGGALTIGQPLLLRPAPGGGWWLTGSVLAGGADAGIVLPFLYRNGALTSLFPGGTLAGLFGEDGLSTSIPDLGIGLDGDIALTINFSPTSGGSRTAIARRRPDGAFQRILEENAAVLVDGVAKAPSAISVTSQPFTSEKTLAMAANLDGGVETILAARETTAAPAVQIDGPRQRRTALRRLTIRGAATDDGTVRQVLYRVNRSGDLPAEGTTRWNFTTPRLREGRNRIAVHAVDGDGGVSAPAQLIVRRVARR